MKINWRSFMVTLLLVLVLLLTLLCGVGIFISGPKYASEAEIKKIESIIQTKVTNIQNLQRHVFRFVVYVGTQEDTYLFFNEEGDKIASRQINKENEQKAIQIIKKNYGLEDFELMIGYGIDHPVYAVENEQAWILLDYDTLKEVYYLKKG